MYGKTFQLVIQNLHVQKLCTSKYQMLDTTELLPSCPAPGTCGAGTAGEAKQPQWCTDQAMAVFGGH